MPKFSLSQSFNNASAKNFSVIDTDAPTMQGLVDLMPAGMSVFQPGTVPAVGTLVPAPTYFKHVEASCFKINPDGSTQGTYVKLPYVKVTKEDADVVNALVGKVDVPDGTISEFVNVKRYRFEGTAPTA